MILPPLQLLLLSLSIYTSNAAKPKKTKLLYQFPSLTRLENIAVLPNGHLLLSLLTAPKLYTLNPFTPHPTPSLLHTFPNATSTFGITELHPNIFALATGNFSLSFSYQPSNVAIWELDFNTRTPQITLKAKLAEGVAINGLAAISRTKVVGSDVGAGVVYAIDLVTGQSRIALNDATTKGRPEVPAGANGLKVRGKYLHFVNYGLGLYARVPLNPNTGTTTGPPEIITSNLTSPDDFALAKDGTAFVASLGLNALVKVGLDGRTEGVAGGADGRVFTGPTAAGLGRGRGEGWVYVVSSGTVFNSSSGGFDSVEGGKVVVVQL